MKGWDWPHWGHRGRASGRIFRPDFPIDPKRWPFFYGWVILAASILGVVASIPGQTIGISVFTDHLIRVTGLTRLELSNAYLLGTLTSGLLLPFGGKVLDRRGARLTFVASALGLAATLGYLSVSDFGVRWLIRHLPAAAGTAIAIGLMGLGFVCLRFTGQGMLTMTSRTTLGKWFERRRGQVSGLESIFVSFGFAAAPLGLSAWIGVMGWRGAWISLGMAIALVVGLLGWLLVRDNPEVCGLRMDGDSPIATDDQTEAGVSSESFRPIGHTRREALATLAFWAISLAFASQSLAITGITFHIVDIGAEAGLSEPQTVAIFLPMAIAATAVGYGIGIACDRTRMRYLITFMMVFQTLGIFSMAHLATLRWLAILGLGTSGGCFGTLSTVALPRFFGRAHLGAIAGFQMMLVVIASALGPSLLAAFRQYLGSYRLGLYLCCLLPPVVITLMMMTDDPSAHQ
ncbi:MFS transporter [filamentous cyanobacterium CCP5]|nr:MFS transporter [filamentous cyanobacterium CCP5]